MYFDEEKKHGEEATMSLPGAVDRQHALELQKQRFLKKQQSRRGSGGPIQANRAFTGAPTKISMSAQRGSFRNFSAPKSIDPLDADDAGRSDAKKFKETGYAKNFKGSSRTINMPHVYEELVAEESKNNAAYHHGDPSSESHRVANVAVKERQNVGDDIAQPFHAEPASMDERPQRLERSESKREESIEQTKPQKLPGKPSCREVSLGESKIEEKLKQRGIATSFDPDEAGDEALSASQQRKGSFSSKKGRSSSELSKSKARAKSRRDEKARRESESSSDKDDSETPRSVEKDAGSAEEAPPPLPKKPSMKKRSSSKRPTSSDRTGSRSSESKKDGSRRKKGTPRGESEEDENDDMALDGGESKNEAPDQGHHEKLATLNFADPRMMVNTAVKREAGVVQCYIERNKSGTAKLYPEYHLFLKDGDRFILAAKKRPKNRTSNYVISLDAKDLKKGSPNFVGKLRANFLGTEFQVFDKGVNPKNADPNALKANGTRVREELGCILYASNVLGSRGPRKMKAAVPAVDDEGNRAPGAFKKSESLLSRFKDRDMHDVIELVNKPPRWNDNVGAYVLNFNGRVTMASVKNFQLVTPEDEDSIVLQFGRVGKDLFTMDFSWPLTPLQAFSICLSSFDGKLACE